jgi:hypothetical protein
LGGPLGELQRKRKMTKQITETSESLVRLAKLAVERKAWTEACNYVEKALKINGDDLDAREMKIRILVSFGEKKEAEARLQETIYQFPQAPEPLLQLARLAAEREGWTEASNYVEKALQINGDHYGARKLKNRLKFSYKVRRRIWMFVRRKKKRFLSTRRYLPIPDRVFFNVRVQLARLTKMRAPLGADKNPSFAEIERMENDFNLFTCKFSSMLCARCSGSDNAHHIGLINNFLKFQTPVSSEHNEAFFDDVENGLFHGIMTCFVIFLLERHNSDLNDYTRTYIPPNWQGNRYLLGKYCLEKLFASGLLHGFVAVVPDKSMGADKLIPNLLKEVWVEQERNSNVSLTLARKIEENRYGDAGKSPEQYVEDIFESTDAATRKTLQYFYKVIRPTLEHLYINRDDIFIRHGLEETSKQQWQPESIYPPENSFEILRIEREVEEEYGRGAMEMYPIEHDRLPFCRHPESISIRQSAFCSHHDTMTSWGEITPWGQIKGFIPLKEFRKHDSSIVHTEKRDHLYAVSQIPARDWIFTYQHAAMPPPVPKANRGRWRKYRWLYPFHDRRQEVVSMSENGLRVLSLDTVFEFHNLVKLVTDRMRILNNGLD